MFDSVKISALLLLAAMGTHAQAEDIQYTIDGRVEGAAAEKVSFSVFSFSGKRDSAEIRDGKFHFSGTLPEPSPVFLSLEGGNPVS